MPISSDISRAAEILRTGGVVAIPTETVYGLAAAINQQGAIQKIFDLKERPLFDPLIVHLSEFNQLRGVVSQVPAVAELLIRTFSPGPLTVVLPKRESVSDLITAGLDTVAIRFPSHPVARDLISRVGVPLAAPSANKFGKTSPTSAAHVIGDFGDDLFVLEGGNCDLGIESTVVQIIDGEVTVLRPGLISNQMLAECLGRDVRRATSQASPGHLETHYQPAVPLVIVGEGWKPEPLKDLLKISELKWRAIILGDDPRLAARTLYSQMRATTGHNCLVVERNAKNATPDWDAIWDRLTKAASLNLST